MNGSKSKDLQEEPEIKFTDILPEPAPQKVAPVIQKAPPIVQKEQPVISQEKSQEAAKKHQEFFGATVFDEEKDMVDEKIEDDILNVPAFFRRRNN